MLKIGMNTRLCVMVGMIVTLVWLGQWWAAANFEVLRDKLASAGVDLTDVEQQIVLDNTQLPLMVMGVSLVMAALVAWLMANYLIRPVKTLSRSVRCFADGDFDHRVDIRTGDEVEELGAVFNQMADKIQKKTRALEEAAIRDQLTGLFNRRHLLEALQLEIARCERAGGAFCIAILDVDHFKRWNDTHGHLSGDEALKAVADLLRRSCRRIDTVARFGGEEFVLVLPQGDLSHGREACLRVRQLVEEARFVGATGGHQETLTISIGVSAYPADGLTFDELLAVADARLYACKKSGRNMVVWGEGADDRGRRAANPEHVRIAHEQATPVSAEATA